MKNNHRVNINSWNKGGSIDEYHRWQVFCAFSMFTSYPHALLKSKMFPLPVHLLILPCPDYYELVWQVAERLYRKQFVNTNILTQKIPISVFKEARNPIKLVKEIIGLICACRYLISMPNSKWLREAGSKQTGIERENEVSHLVETKSVAYRDQSVSPARVWTLW